MRTLPILCSMALLLAAGAAQAQRFDTVPVSADVVAGEPLQITLSGLPPHAEVTLSASRAVREFTGGRRVYASQASFVAGADGRLDLATQAPLAGSYAGADLRGLFWSMVPKPGADDAAAYADGEVRLHARIGKQTVATRTLRLRAAAATLQWRDAAEFPGAKLAWLPSAEPAAADLAGNSASNATSAATGSASGIAPGNAPARPAVKRPAIIALGGSEGGSAVLQSAGLLASHGFAVLGLPYYSPGGYGPGGPTPPELPGLPAAFADIPVQRLEQARAWLAQQPEVDASRIAVYGVSKGAEFALIAATRMPWITSVVAIVPSDVVWEGWGPGIQPGTRASFAWNGQPLPFVPYLDFDKEFMGFQTGEPVLIRRPQDKGRAANPGRIPAARIAVETYAGPLLVVGSDGDQVWDSGGMADNIAKSRAAAGRDTVVLVFRDAGHAISGTGWSPTTQYNAGPMKMGGSPAADARAQAQAFEQTLAFLRRTLAGSARP